MDVKELWKKLNSTNISGKKSKNSREFKADLNFLPAEKRFYFYKHIIKTLLFLILVLNVSFILFLWGAGIYANMILKKHVNEKKGELKKVETLYNTLLGYEKKYKSDLKKLAKIKKEIKEVKESAFIRKSAYASTAVFFSKFFNGISMRSLVYENGSFTLTGTADTETAFRTFFKSLESDQHINNIRFFYLKRQKDGTYAFKVSAEVDY